MDVNASNGFNVGQNTIQTVVPQGASVVYRWYAGEFDRDPTGHLDATPIEFGTIGLTPADPLFQHAHGLVGVLIIEPAGSHWSGDDRTRAIITPTRPTPRSNGLVPRPFSEFVLVLQDQTAAQPTPPTTTNFSAINYKNEPMIQRYKPLPPGGAFAKIDVSQALSNSLLTPPADPQTPILKVKAGEPVRIRLVHTGGTTYWAWAVDGHSWQRAPYQARSVVLDYNPLSEQTGEVGPNGPYDVADVLIDRAGGRFAVPGDYLYRTLTAGQLQNGQWGILRVVP